MYTHLWGELVEPYGNGDDSHAEEAEESVGGEGEQLQADLFIHAGRHFFNLIFMNFDTMFTQVEIRYSYCLNSKSHCIC